ncbi:hypothetical protein D8674_012804 [Pyrus ussuriensis x Pyrus communis]|uniref:Uncharacterized protein n=1 Tax=Pyrus ussuriensis x Pyrus communis TaxID=2448454 RepID=A0A5N5GMY6_9ROSA|nr:hypothetical protein D8674_012804 [Pyrus ussuriensis x Pyrus communis]
MADFGEGSGKRKLVAEAYAEFKCDIGNLVQRDCSAKFESWKKVLEELKKYMLRELYKNVKANKSSREKKTFFHHSGLRPFSYRMEAGVQNSRKSMSSATFMFDLGMSWPSQFIIQ